MKSLINKFLEIIQGNDLRGNLIKTSFSSLAVNSIGKILAFGIGTLLVHALGKAGFGKYTYVFSLIYVLIIPAEFGIATLLMRETAKNITEEKPELIHGNWRWSVLITLIVSSVFITATIIGVDFFTSQNEQLDSVAFYWGIGLLPLQALVLLSSSGLRGLNKVILSQIPDLILTPAFFILIILSVIYIPSLELSPSIAMALRTFATLISLIFCVFQLKRHTPKEIITSEPVYQRKPWISSALPLMFSTGINMIKSRVNILILGLFVTAGQIGTFQVAISTASLAYVIMTAINSIIAPQFTSLHSKGDINKLQRLTSLSARVIFVFNLLLTIVFIFFGKYLLTLIFGTELIDAYTSLIILLIGQVINSALGSVNILLNMTGYEKDVMKIIIISSVINVFITLVFSPNFGIISGAVAISISLILSQFLMYRLVRKKLGIISHAFVRLKF